MKLLALFFLLIASGNLIAQDQDSTETSFEVHDPDSVYIRQYNSEKLEVRKFNSEAWRKIIGEANFEEKIPEVKAPRQQKQGGIPWAGTLLRIIAYVLVTGLVVFIIYYLIRNTSIDQLTATRTVKEDDATSSIEDIEGFDMHLLLHKALTEGNFPLVVRYYYLDLLKNLNAAGLIAWKKDKTNLDYLMELFSRNFHFAEIRKLTLAYELVWYGERPLTRMTLDQLIRDFEIIHQRINKPVAP